jgi:hypothetical protein
VWITSTRSASEGSSRTSSGVPSKFASTGSNPKRNRQQHEHTGLTVGARRTKEYSCPGCASPNSKGAIPW